jgi:ribosomal protein S18 acetylase RimI-like enzyme
VSVNFKLDLANRSDLSSVVEVRRTGILADAPSAMQANDVVVWAEESKDIEIIDQIDKKNILVARSDSGEVIGWIRAENDCVEGLFVSGEYQHMGIGRALLLAIEHDMAKQGITTVRLQSSLNAIEFYKSCGYVEAPNNIDFDTLSMGKCIHDQRVHNEPIHPTSV